MHSGRDRLKAAAVTLLAEHPDREPSTRELYEVAGVAAPTLYHHFGTKEGLLAEVVDDAFARYLERKQTMPRTGDLLADFATGWDMHVSFGVEHPVLYALMYGRQDGQPAHAAVSADAELYRGLEQLAAAGLLQMDVDDALALTNAMAIGCVTQLNRTGGSPDDALAHTMRTTWLAALTGQTHGARADHAAKTLISRVGSATGLFTPAESALLRQWLRALVTHFEDTAGSAATTRSPRGRKK